MRQVKLEASTERTILLGIIVSDKLIGKLSHVYRPEYFESDYVRTVANWCFDFYKEYGTAPKKNLTEIYNQKRKSRKVDQDAMDNIARVLKLASKHFKRQDKFNYKHILDISIRHFEKQGLKKLNDDLDSLLEDDNIQDGKALVANFSIGSVDSSRAINPLTDQDLIRESFTEDRKPVFKMPGELGRMINGDLCRESFIGLMGMEKIGKTWTLLEFMMQAAKQRCNTLMFQAGDMTEAQQIRRIHIRLSGKSDRRKYCGDIYVPTLDCYYNQLNRCDLSWRTGDEGLVRYLKLKKEDRSVKGIYEALTKRERFLKAYKRAKGSYHTCTECIKKQPFSFRGMVWYKRIHVDNPLTWREAVKFGNRFQKKMGKKNFRLITYSNDTLTCREMNNRMDILEKEEGFIPDVVGVDYPDIMVAEDGSREERHKENSKWKGLRRISQERRCCLIAPTQANALSYGKDSLDPSNFSEDKRKYSHVTSMLSLNQTITEKILGIIRVAQLFVRDDEFTIDRQVAVLQCLQIGRPYIASYKKHF